MTDNSTQKTTAEALASYLSAEDALSQAHQDLAAARRRHRALQAKVGVALDALRKATADRKE